MLYEAAPLLAAQESITWAFPAAAMTPVGAAGGVRIGVIRLPPPDEQAVAESTRNIRSNAKADA
jgi:hypothetical protein